jgi:signal transduction histidine kinase/ligand-binding sensor domain-containing protein
MRHGLVIGLLSFTFTAGLTQSQFRIEYFEIPDGVNSPLAYSIVQDSLGFLWIHYTGGLARFDGYGYKIYRYSPSDSVKSPGKLLDGQMFLDRSRNVWTRNNQVYDPGRLLVLSRYDRAIDGFLKYQVDLDSSRVRDICFDKSSPIVWLGTFYPGRGLYSYNTGTKEVNHYLISYSDLLPKLDFGDRMEPRNAISGIIDLNSHLLLATFEGLWQFDKATKQFSRPVCNPKDSSTLYNLPVLDMIEKPQYFPGQIWLTVNRGLTTLDKNMEVVNRYDFPEGFLTQEKEADFDLIDFTGIDVDKEGVVWMATDNDGLFRYNPADNNFSHLWDSPAGMPRLQSNSLTGVIVDKGQNIWTTSRDQWASKLRNQDVHITQHSIKNLRFAIPYEAGERSYLIVDRSESVRRGDNELLIAHLNQFKTDSLRFQQIRTAGPINGLVNYLHAGNRYLWMGTWDDGVFALPMNVKDRIVADGPIIRFQHDPENPNTISSNATRGMWEDPSGNLWLGTQGQGLNKISPPVRYGKPGSVTRYVHSDTDSTSIGSNVILWEFCPEDETSFWVRTGAGVDLFRNNRFEHFFRDEFAYTIRKNSAGTVFISAFGGEREQGLYEGDKDGSDYRFSNKPTFTQGTGFLEDSLGRMWFTGSGAKLICYDPKEKYSIEFSERDGLGHSLQSFKMSNGILVLTEASRISLVDPYSLRVNKDDVYPVLTQLMVNNKVPNVQAHNDQSDEFTINRDISILDVLTLDYQHNNFSIEFSALEMTATEKNLYRHRLEDYDPGWIETNHKNRTATYTNLPSGTYTFRVIASNYHGIWSDNERTLEVIILPPPWRTWWAYSGYLLAVVSLLLAARRMIVQRERLKGSLALAKVAQEKEHFELEKAIEVDRVKTSFFTNISHEFRTPLTLIKGPVRSMMDQFMNGQSEVDREKIVSQLKLVERNSDLLLKLINQLLDLAKLEAGTLKVEKSEGDLFSFIRAIGSSFESLARQKGVNLTIDVPSGSAPALFDKDKLETILINLVNNAIKFTPGGGTVTVGLTPFPSPEERGAVKSVNDSAPRGSGTFSSTVSRPEIR